MSELWAVTQPDTGSALLRDTPTVTYEPDDSEWDKCPIDNSPHQGCFTIPGVINGTQTA